MTKDIWINLPVKDIAKSKAFFASLGFNFHERDANSDVSACMLVGNKNFPVMLFAEPLFKGFIGGHEIADAHQAGEILISIDAESRAEVDELAKKAVAAGGKLYGPPGEKEGWMYGCGFSDLDGHRWNVLHMDMSKMPKP